MTVYFSPLTLRPFAYAASGLSNALSNSATSAGVICIGPLAFVFCYPHTISCPYLETRRLRPIVLAVDAEETGLVYIAGSHEAVLTLDSSSEYSL